MTDDQTRREVFFNIMIDHLSKNGSAVIRTVYKGWKVSKKHSDMLKFKKGSMYLQSGKSWNCIDGCQITLQ